MSSKAQRRVLVGLQAAAGTGVNVDTAVRGTCSLKPDVDKRHPDENIGSYAPARHYVASVRPSGGLTLDGTYEQCLIPLSMALGEPTPSAGPPYTWAFPWPDLDAAVLDFALWSLEYTDGANAIVRGEDVFAKSLTITGEAGGSWEFSAELDGGAVTFPAALTANPALDDTVTPIRMAETLLYIDTTYAGIGVTNCEELISFVWKLEEFQHAKQFAGSLYPNGRGNDKWKITLDLILEAEAAETELLRDAALATTQYAVRVRGYVDANDSIIIDGMYMVESVDALDDRDGNNTLKITLQGEKDASDNTGGITVITDVAAL
jgi:hypothetical protein